MAAGGTALLGVPRAGPGTGTCDGRSRFAGGDGSRPAAAGMPRPAGCGDCWGRVILLAGSIAALPSIAVAAGHERARNRVTPSSPARGSSETAVARDGTG